MVTTSVDSTQLEGVLWGEIRRFIQTAKYPLDESKGGPLLINHLHLRKVYNGEVCGISYLQGRVAAKGEGMLGHHVAATGDGIPRTLMIADEASGVDDLSFERSDTWANRKLIIGNPYPTTNYFYRAVKEGSIRSKDKRRYYRKIIHIAAEDSPNVRLGLEQQKRGVEPTNELVMPGVLPWDMYQKRLETWDEVKQCIGLKGMFYEGSDTLLFPGHWLERAHRVADENAHLLNRNAVSIGIDPAQGGDRTTQSAVDTLGLLDQNGKKTPDTDMIPREALAFMRKHQVAPEYMIFDAGGGGKQHADRLRGMGYPVRIVGFGEGMTNPIKSGLLTRSQRRNTQEERQVFKNRRAEMYWALRELLDPSLNPQGFGIPREYTELIRQLKVIPLTYDIEGRLFILPKDRKPGQKAGTEKTLKDLLGCSPDEADSFVLAIWGMQHRPEKRKVGGLTRRQ